MAHSASISSSSPPLDGTLPQMDGSDLPAAAGDTTTRPTATATATATAGDGGAKAEEPPRPERCEALAAAIAAALGGAFEDYEARDAAAGWSQDALLAAVDRLNGELDKLLEDAPSAVIMQHAARISSIRKRVLALNLLLRSIQRRIDNIDRVISAGLTSDNSTPVQSHNQR